jgi:beta-galactosidase/beta-glucuronidase
LRKKPASGEKVWLKFRGINYSCEIFVNGQKVNKEPFEGMFLRKAFDITNLLASNGKNRLAVIVYPSNSPGNPNGGQGGDGTIAKNVAIQYTAGWDWIRPIRDRNTGIWDKVQIEKTGLVNLKDPHVITLVSGVRTPEGLQQPATVKTTAELENTSDSPVSGVLSFKLNGQTVSEKLTLPAKSSKTYKIKDLIVNNPKLWWPAGYGPQNLYDAEFSFTPNGQKVSDFEKLQVGIREIQTSWNTTTQSRQIAVNGQKIFIKGGNWIIRMRCYAFQRNVMMPKFAIIEI